MWRYDNSLTPPAPILDVVIATPGFPEQNVSLRGKLDIGADLTVIPEQFVETLDLPIRYHTRARGYDGSSRSCPVYVVDLKLGGFNVDSTPCIATRRDNVLLGREVLNLFFITLDGPNLTFDMKQE